MKHDDQGRVEKRGRRNPFAPSLTFSPASGWRRNLRAAWRDTLLLLRQFAGPLLIFALVIIGGGLLYYWLALRAGEPVDTPAEAIYLVLGLAFFQSSGDFPHVWYLQLFYFAMPVLGLGILAAGLADFGSLFFNRRARRKEWEMAVASTFNRHLVLIGLGHLGFRVMETLVDTGQEVVVIEQTPKLNLVEGARRLGVPVIEDDGRRLEALEGAGTARARGILLCTQNDVLNLQIAFQAQRLNPDIEVVVRIFDDQFADDVARKFGFRALSATGLAAPAFASAASGVDVTRPITVDGRPFSLASQTIRRRSPLVGQTVGEIEGRYDVSVVLLRRDGASDPHPAAGQVVAARDVVAVLGEPERIARLTAVNR
ncbi:MAG: NAD-binding protein [Anaerolineae bacterium]|uniref:potassium channel family protein n=1 Tax=Promineifilum sp. TaxID=2664178 RepID=UPI001D9C4FB9|nr:NAD-binding protein [Anaerolineales bacterium]MCO5178848.1 NAD-binding protein [Promineifilum sp.]MCW5848381.1 NAD-binding protein [Anaerolineae bacterium]